MAASVASKPFLGAATTNGSSRHSDSAASRLSSSRSPFAGDQRQRRNFAAGSTFGNYSRVAAFGESHGGGVRCIIDGCPPRIPLSESDMQVDLDSKGGGRSSARETIGRVAPGAVAKKILKQFSGTEILAYVSQVHKVVLPEVLIDHETLTLEQIESNIVRCPDPEYAEKMIAAINAVWMKGDSVGGVVTCIVRNAPRVFDELEAELAKAVISVPAAMGFECGSGFAGTFFTGSEHNDEFYTDEHGGIRTRTNRSGGIQGGISNGEIINMRVAFKPTPTVGRRQNTVTRDKKGRELIIRGRFDPCVAPRAVPIVEAMVALVLDGTICTMPSVPYQSRLNGTHDEAKQRWIQRKKQLGTCLTESTRCNSYWVDEEDESSL